MSAALARAFDGADWRFDEAGFRATAVDLGWALVGVHSSGARLEFSTAQEARVHAVFSADRLVSAMADLEDPLLDPSTLTPPERHGALAMFEAAFVVHAEAIASVLGSPVFQGSRGDPGFPADEELAQALARWPGGIADILLRFERQDDHTPVTLMLTLEPHPAPPTTQ